MSAHFVHASGSSRGSAESRNPIWAALLGSAAALPACAWLWGFTVDDALISARVAAHCAQGLGPRFNPHGPVTDAVTPLGYAQLLGVLAQRDTLRVLFAAKCFGALSWLVAAALLAVLVERAGSRLLRFAPLAIVALSAPLGAWAVSGMETGFVTLLATLGLFQGRGGTLCLGCAAALRPELVPFAAVLIAGRTAAGPNARAEAAWRVLLALPPLALVALIRGFEFGRIVPLSFYAKPSDFAHGLRYALGALAFTGLPWLLWVTPRELGRAEGSARGLLAALIAHFAALVLCGGDWMAMYRLVVPVLPCAALAAAYLAERARPALTALRFAVASASALLLGLGLGPSARQVGEERTRLIAQARPVFARYERIAALDVGWLGAARDAEIIDLAGVTDPVVAAFPGGHTSKRIPRAWLFAEHPDALLLLLAPGAPLETPFEQSSFARAVEQRVAMLVAGEFRVRTTLPFGAQRYVVLERVQ